MSEKEGVIVGDDTPENHRPAEEQQAEDKTTNEQAKEAETKEEAKLYAGKFKSPEDLEKSYSELERMKGEQGSEIGNLRKEKEFLMSQIQQMQTQNKQAPAEDTDKAADIQAQLAEISQLVEDGEMTIGEGMVKSAQISAQMAQENALQGVQAMQQQQALDNSKQSFAEQNPDFFELQQSGALEEVKNSLPGFHDDVSAYYAKKATDTQTAMEAAVAAAKAEGMELGKAEGMKLATGDKNTQKVLQKPGGNAESISRKKGSYTRSELQQSGLDALQRARGA